ncbi:LacI family transcriptional regulator [Sphingomonas oleivorans]|uniref:LacI family transcriptional regulator n=1 Tax=Sphingomonas oleivorans TaxID=1735121 RepID=A0A2T5FYH6_9SPHN|nr:LacI family DNA-binding transcriptional regulator [Sphingomonas oleivorans]PTQ11566.1 LacI family transcriptional regulator [Sphingomonas oleivorans]
MAVGIKDVARLASVSPATVSRVLGGRAVDPAMRARVEAAVAATGYHPNLSARRLRSRHNNTVGLIVADIRNPFFTAVSRTVEDAAYARGLRVILCNTDEDPAREDMYLRLMHEERVTGVILAPTRPSADRVAGESQDFPMVLIDRSIPLRMHDAVVLNNEQAAMTLVEHLHAQGYRRIAGLFGAASTTGVERHDGYVRAMTRLGLSPMASFVDHGYGAVEAEVARLMTGPEPPDALIASNGVMLMRVCRALHAAGLSVPEAMGLAGFDNEPWTELVGEGLTVIEQPVEDIGRTAMAMLLDRLDAPDTAPRKVMLAGRCVVRGSTKGRNIG